MRPVLQLLTLWEQSFVIFAGYHADWCSRLFRISIFKHIPFCYFIFFLLLVVWAAIDYSWLVFTKEMLCKMWKSKHIWLQVKRTSTAYKIYRRNQWLSQREEFARSLTYVYLRINLWVLLLVEFFASHSVCTTVAWGTNRWVKFVDEVGSTVFYKNLSRVYATSRAITKADLPLNFTIFHCRMSTIQPAWPDCITSECWHTCCWHFCSCSSLKTIPSLKELLVTLLFVWGCYVTALSTSITQALMIITWVGWKS